MDNAIYDTEEEWDESEWDNQWKSGDVFWHNDMIMTSELFPFIELD